MTNGPMPLDHTKSEQLKNAFLFWQCKVRQIIMREKMGQPDLAIRPTLFFSEKDEPLRQLTVLISRHVQYSMTPEMQHIVRSTPDPAQRREKAVKLFAATYFAEPKEFSDILTATFQPASPMVDFICSLSKCSLLFEGYGKKFILYCEASRVEVDSPLFEATWWHNLLFNPYLHPETAILSFKPKWCDSRSETT